MKNFLLEEYLQDLEQVVNIDSHAEDVSGVTAVGNYYKEKLVAAGYKVHEFDMGPEIAHPLLLTNTDEDEYDVLLMAHLDTVFHHGEATKRPFTIIDGVAHGPGCNDMKSGGILGVHALVNNVEELKDLRIAYALNPEEEQSSKHVRAWLEALSKKSKNVIILEPARENGDHVDERKGIGRFTFKFTGRTAHAGNNPAAGRSAIHEMGYWICELAGLTNFDSGFTVNVGLVSGGTGANVVAGEGQMTVDIRMQTLPQVDIYWHKLEELKAHATSKEVKVEVLGGITRPPMFKTEATEKLVALVNKAAEELGLPCNWVKAGAGSDGNFSAALGVPTVDALGPSGGKSHTAEEYMLVASVEPAYKLLVRTLELLR